MYLTHQYRMNADIMSLSNTLIYHDRLRCGSAELAEKGLPIPNKEALESLSAGCDERRSCWVRDVMDERSVFIGSAMRRNGR